MEEDAVNVPERANYIKGREKSLLIITITSYSIALFLAALISFWAVIVLLFPLLIGVLYSVEISPKLPRLKSITGMKNFIVALSWTVGAVFIPVSCASVNIIKIIPIFYFLMVKLIVNAVTFDLRDIKGDKKSGVKTIPVVLGRKKTKNFLYLLQFTLFPFLAILTLIGLFKLYWIIIVFSIVYGFLYVYFFSKKDIKLPKMYRDLIVDGEWILISIMVLI